MRLFGTLVVDADVPELDENLGNAFTLQSPPWLLNALHRAARAPTSEAAVQEQLKAAIQHELCNGLWPAPPWSKPDITEELFDFERRAVEVGSAGGPMLLTEELIREANRIHGCGGIYYRAGHWRTHQMRLVMHFRPHVATMDAGFARPSVIAQLMTDFVHTVNAVWRRTDPIVLAAFIFWRILNIHPFSNGNGHAARSIATIILCRRLGGWLPFSPVFAQELRQRRLECYPALVHAGRTFQRSRLDIGPVHSILCDILAAPARQW